MSDLNSVRYVDSHTAGEPTRIVVSGGPDLGNGSLGQRVERFKDSFDWFRAATVNEPRGWDALVGGLLCQPSDPSCSAAAIFFNNVGFLGMCGHATIGLAVTLHHLGQLDLGHHRIETPVGVVKLELRSPNEVVLENVPSYRWKSNVTVDVDTIGTVTGDIAWGGNWFFLVESSPVAIEIENIDTLISAAAKVRQSLQQHGITGANGAEIDHVEFFSAADSPDAHSKNFVLCPGGEYDRSPCGTGSSAKLACLAADGKLAEHETWIQESIIGSQFRCSYRHLASSEVACDLTQPHEPAAGSGDGLILPTLTGSAFVCSQGQFVDMPTDPFRHGITSQPDHRGSIHGQ